MIPPHLLYQIYLSFLEQNDCTPPKCGELSEYTDSAHTYTDSAHTEVEDLSSRYMNGSNVYDQCGHDTRLLHPSKYTSRYQLQPRADFKGPMGRCKATTPSYLSLTSNKVTTNLLF